MNLADPATHDETELIAKVDEALQVVRWDEFVAWLRETYGRTGRWALAMTNAAGAFVGPPLFHEAERRMVDFAESEGWPAVLSAIARAMTAEARIDQAVGR